MGFKEIGPSSTVIDIKKEIGPVHIGTYTGKKQIETQMGEQVIWQFQADEGDSFGIYGFTNLNRIMETVPLGEMVRITYTGTENVKTKKFGMKNVHQVKVELWEDDEAVKKAESVLGAKKINQVFDERNPPPFK